ncbi:MAG: VOC family protein [Alphaproteobacteria bacterium]
MSKSHGRFAWYELLTSDMDAAMAFYGTVVGWATQEASAVPGMRYVLFTADGTPVCGVMKQPDEIAKAGAPPGWIGYVEVDDVDAGADKAARAGATVHVPPSDIPNIGRFAVLLDPQSVALGLITWANPMPEPPTGMPSAGRVGWHELLAADREEAFAYYSSQFGWQMSDALDMGPMGIYQLYAHDGQTLGGMMTKPPFVPVPFWLYYFVVGGIDAAVARVTVAGGKIVNGPMEVPGGAWIIQGMDPQGAMFALVGSRTASA